MDVVIGNGRKVEVLGKEEAKDVVGVFIQSSLPGRLGMGEIDLSVERIFKIMVQPELNTVIQRNGLHRKFVQGSNQGFLGLQSIETADFPGSEETGFAVNKGRKTTFAKSSADGITLPVTDRKTSGNILRPVGNQPIRLDHVIFM